MSFEISSYELMCEYVKRFTLNASNSMGKEIEGVFLTCEKRTRLLNTYYTPTRGMAALLTFLLGMALRRR